MGRLRRLSTTRLLAASAAVLAVLVVGVAIAGAVSTSGSPPPPKPLPQAVHDAISAPAPVGISARITFTSRLVDTSMLGDRVTPLLKGASGRLWVAEGGRLRIELQSDQGDTQVVSDGKRFLFTDPSSNTVYTGTLPADHNVKQKRAERKPSVADVQKGIGRLGRFASVTGPGREVVGGHSAYSVRVTPLHNSGLLGGVGAAWDAVRGVPLRLAVYARGVSAPVLELQATDVSYGPVAASTFTVSPPAHSRIHRINATGHDRGRAAGKQAKEAAGKRHGQQAPNLAAIGKAVPFKLSAPAQLAGLSRSDAHLLGGAHGSSGAAIVYGRPLLGGLVVIESKPGKTKAAPSATPGDRGQGVNLPHVKIGSADVTELATALGTAVSFDRGGVHYVVVGTVGKAVAEEAARGL
ncbi:MAG: hypothetical protein JOZ25_08010 [Actinobacteria bacterium]|nr:hypothetical protein [Actinomycetota bacterium]